MPTIRIDDEVYAWLQTMAKPFEDTPNTVLRWLMQREASLRQPSLTNDGDGEKVRTEELSENENAMGKVRERLVDRVVQDLQRKTGNMSIKSRRENGGLKFALECASSRRFAVIRPFRPRLGVTSVNVALEKARAAGIPPGVPQKVERGRWFGQDGLRLDIPTEGQGYNEAIYQEVLNFLERLGRLL